MKESNLENANLYYADLAGGELTKAVLKNADLRFANFGGANLTAEQLSQCASLENAKGLSKKMLEELRRMKPELVEWWNGGEWDEKKEKYVPE